MSSYWDEEDDPDDIELPMPVPNRTMLAGFLVPGWTELPEGEPGRKLDEKNAAGAEGATQTWHGYEPAEIKLVVHMWRASHRETWRRLLAVILPQPGKPPAGPFSIVNDGLLDYGIDKVLVTKVSMPKTGKHQGEVLVTITMKDWLKPKKTGTTTPKAVASGPATVHQRKGGSAPAIIGPPAPPVDPASFNPQPPTK